MSDADLSGDGVPDLALESYSGGAHCCWTYYIISLGEKPRLIKQFDNERGAGFVRNRENRRVDIVTQDGASTILTTGATPARSLPTRCRNAVDQ
jgi:hypothetical protein